MAWPGRTVHQPQPSTAIEKQPRPNQQQGDNVKKHAASNQIALIRTGEYNHWCLQIKSSTPFSHLAIEVSRSQQKSSGLCESCSMSSTEQRAEHSWQGYQSQDQSETLTDLEREVLDEYVKLRDNLGKVNILTIYFTH